jgi:hypothetical protein
LWLERRDACYHECTMWNTVANNELTGFKKTAIWLSVSIAVCTLAGICIWLLWFKSSRFFPEAIVESSSKFSLYYPTELPEGYYADKNSFSRAAGVLTFTAVNQQKEHLNFSLQARPANYDFEGFYNLVLKDTFRYVTPHGEAAIGYAQDLTVGSILTENTWIIVSSGTKNLDTDDIQSVLVNLKKQSK